LAQEKNKVAVLSETGQEALKNPNWFTEVILNPIKENDNIKIAYVMVWRNAFNRENHFYAPYPGHPSESDFKMFYHDDKVFFESEIQNMYKQGKPLSRK
jgi:mannan endo-1,4-beta-mannosidase